MKYLSVCSGIEAATVAWHHLGWEPVGFSEIEPFPSAVLKHHYPNTPNLGDMTKYKEWDIGSIDLLVGGTPCQSFSVAGLRKGLEDPRGNLALVYCGILDHFRPRWFVWENVPGVLSSAGGRDFGSFLGALAQLGYGFAYRVLDAQWFGVAQRRRRVFVVGHFGDWRPAAAVLFERESLRRDTAPSREKRQDPAKCLTASPSRRFDAESETMIPVGIPDVMYTLLSSTAGVSRTGNAATEHETYIPMAPIPYDLHQITAPVNRQAREPGDPCHTLAKQNAHNAGIVSIQGNLIGREAGGSQGVSASDEGVMYTLTKADVHEVAQPIPLDSMNHLGRGDDHSLGRFEPGAPSYTLTKGHHHAVAQPVGIDYEYNAHSLEGPTEPLFKGSPTGGGHPLPAVMQSMAVRRLTPIECERLQGFPDNYTAIPWRGKTETPDGPRYKALGNSMAVPVMRWIGERIKNV